MATEEAEARAAVEEEVIRARIVKKRQWRNMCALAREQNWAVCAMVGLPLKEEKEDSDGEDSSGDEQIWLDPYCIFNWYYRCKGTGKGKGGGG